MIQDPVAQVIAAAAMVADDATLAEVEARHPALLSGLRLARRRFGTSLPPPFVAVPDRPGALPVRTAAAADGPAVAVVRRRARGSVGGPEEASAPRTTGGGVLLVAGRPGEVHGVVDVAPPDCLDGPADPLAEVRLLYVDPTVRRHGLGTRLLDAALDRLDRAGRVVAWAARHDEATRRFHERRGSVPEGATRTRDVAGAPVAEVRYRLR